LNVGFVTLLVLHIASTRTPEDQETFSYRILPDTAASDGAAVSPETSKTTETDFSPATIQGYRRVLSALRATGLPEVEVHRILRGAALADWQDDVRRMQQNQSDSDEFWRARTMPFGIDIGSQRKAVELRRAREAALTELIGDRESL